MATHFAELEELKCPLCGTKLTNEEYQNVKQQLKKQFDQERKKEIEQLSKEHEIEKRSIQNRFTHEIYNKETQINELRRQAEKTELEAKARADASARAEIDELQRGVSERDIQLRRLGKEI